MLDLIKKPIDYCYNKKNVVFGLSLLEILLILYRLAFTFITIFVIGRFTSLADIGTYLNTPISEVGSKFFTSGTFHLMGITQVVKAILRIDILVHIFYCILGSVGLVYFLRNPLFKADSMKRLGIYLLFIPSVTIWSSIVTKEALLICMGFIFLSEILSFFHSGKINNWILLIISTVYIIFFKPWFSIGVAQIFGVLIVTRFFKMEKKHLVLTILAVTIVQILCVYVGAEQLNDFAEWTRRVFRVEARSTRPSPFWNGETFFSYLPIGYVLALWGPTLSEASTSFVHLATFIESTLLAGILFFYIGRSLYIAIRTKKINLLHLYLFVSVWFWVLFLAYPLGVYNPGSTIRYRTDFLPLLLFPLFISIKAMTIKRIHDDT